MAVGDRLRQRDVPGRPVGDDDKIAECQRQFGTEHRAHSRVAGRLREPNDAVEPVPVGERERAQPEVVGDFHQSLG